MNVTKFRSMSFALFYLVLLAIIIGGVFVSCDGSNVEDLYKEHNLNISGFVIDATDKGPIEGMSATVWITDKATTVNLATDTSDLEGKYRLGCKYDCLQLLRLRFEAEGYVTYDSGVIPCQTKEQNINIELNRVQ